MDRKCAICGNTHDLFSLEIPGDEPDDPHTIRYVCGKCWDVIAAIAKKAVTIPDINDTTENLFNRIEKDAERSHKQRQYLDDQIDRLGNRIYDLEARTRDLDNRINDLRRGY